MRAAGTITPLIIRVRSANAVFRPTVGAHGDGRSDRDERGQEKTSVSSYFSQTTR